MQYVRKYEGAETCAVEAIDIILEWAPLLLDVSVLDRLAAFLKNHRTIEKNAASDLRAGQLHARAVMWDAYTSWNEIENRDSEYKDFSGQVAESECSQRRSITDAWRRMQVVNRSSLTFCTRVDAPSLAKCPFCGAVAKAKKKVFLEAQACPKCQTKGFFVILARDPTGSHA
jgi:hypothetical protein